jgi:hypothetical protein
MWTTCRAPWPLCPEGVAPPSPLTLIGALVALYACPLELEPLAMTPRCRRLAQARHVAPPALARCDARSVRPPRPAQRRRTGRPPQRPASELGSSVSPTAPCCLLLPTRRPSTLSGRASGPACRHLRAPTPTGVSGWPRVLEEPPPPYLSVRHELPAFMHRVAGLGDMMAPSRRPHSDRTSASRVAHRRFARRCVRGVCADCHALQIRVLSNPADTRSDVLARRSGQPRGYRVDGSDQQDLMRFRFESDQLRCTQVGDAQ